MRFSLHRAQVTRLAAVAIVLLVAAAMAASALHRDAHALGAAGQGRPDPKTLKLMRSYGKALGVKCTHCHVGKKFKEDTPHKQVALVCRDRFEKPLVTSGGKPISCATCHDEQTQFLPERDRDAYCRDNFVQPLRLAKGKKRVTCATCHGDGDPGEFLPER